MTVGEFDDPRDNPDDDPDRHYLEARCRRGSDEAQYAEALVSLNDQVLTEEALDRAVPLDGRWPEPRILRQAEVFYFPDRSWVQIPDLDGQEADVLLETLLGDASAFHAAAVRDEALTTPSGLRRALKAAGVPATADVDPVVWLDGTVLVRSLRRRAGPVR
ncbi:MAG: hypothetical protein NVSMB55_00580 [Mycobacteriales bacterium]